MQQQRPLRQEMIAAHLLYPGGAESRRHNLCSRVLAVASIPRKQLGMKLSAV